MTYRKTSVVVQTTDNSSLTNVKLFIFRQKEMDFKFFNIFMQTL